MASDSCDDGWLEIEQVPNGWMFTASMGDGIHFQVGVEATELAAHRRGRRALEVQRERRAAYEEASRGLS